MKLEFLQAREDTNAFVDFLYDQGYVFSRKTPPKARIPMERQFAKEALITNLITGFGTYYLGYPDAPELLTFESCGNESHPRCAGRMRRYTGAVILSDQYRENNLSVKLFKSIKKYFTEKYLFTRIHDDQRFKCYWGPEYQILDAQYMVNPEPTSICPGYIRIKCAPQFLYHAHKQLQDVLTVHTELQNAKIHQNQWAIEKHIVEAYLSFLFDRSLRGTDDIIAIAKDINVDGCRMRVVREKRHESVSFARKTETPGDAIWDVRVTVEQEWKGFGVFSEPATWMV